MVKSNGPRREGPIVNEVDGSLSEVVNLITKALAPAGFGVLTRIDFSDKIKEKLGESINPCIILGVCHPAIALEAYKQTTDVALLIPCNVVLTKTGDHVRVEAMRPSQMLDLLPKVKPSESLFQAEQALEAAILTLK